MKKISLVLIICLTIIFIGFGCSQTKNTIVKEPIKIGFVGPLTGDVSSLGVVVKAAAEVAVNEVNQAGGIQGRKLEMVYENGGCGPKESTLAVNKLINIDKVTAIVGGICSGETLTIAPVTESNKVILLSPASTGIKISSAGDYVFRLIPSDTFQGKFVAEYVTNQLQKKKIAILYNSDSEWSIGIKDVFKQRLQELGGQVVAEEGIPKSSRDLRSSITKIKVADPEIIYFPSHTESGVIGLQQLAELGVKTPILGGDVWDDPTIPQKVGEAANGVRYPVADNNILSDNFLQSVKQIVGNDDMNTYAPRAYDAVKILAQIMNEVGTDSEKIKTELYNLQDYHGLADTYNFDKNGDVTDAKYSVKEFQNGKIITLQ